MEGVQSADQCSQSWRGDSSSENQASDITQQEEFNLIVPVKVTMEGVQSADQCSQSWRGDSSSENQVSDITQQDSSAKELLELIDKLVSSPDSDTLAKQYLDTREGKKVIDLLHNNGGATVNVYVMSKLTESADVLAAIIRVCASEQLFRLLSTDLRGMSALGKFVYRFENTRLAEILLEIKKKVTPDHWDNLVFQQKPLGTTIFDMVLSKPEVVIKQCARNGTFNELGLLLKQYNKIVDKDYVLLQKTMELYEVDFIDLLVVLHLKQQVALDKLRKCEYLEGRLQKLCVMSQSMDKEQAQASRGQIMKLFGDLQMSVLQVAMSRWSFWKTLVDAAVNNRSVSFEGLIKHTTAYCKRQSEQETSHVSTLLSSKSGREAADLFKELWAGEVVLMLVKDAVMLKTVLSSINDKKEIHDLLMTHYKDDDLHRNIDTPAMLQILTDCHKEQCEPILREIHIHIIKNSELFLVNDSNGDSIINRIIKRGDHDIVGRCLKSMIKIMPEITTKLLLKKNFTGVSSLMCLLTQFSDQHSATFLILRPLIMTGITPKLDFLQCPLDKDLTSLAHSLIACEKGREMMKEMNAEPILTLLLTTDINGNTPLHGLTDLNSLHDIITDISEKEQYKLLSTTNNDGNTFLHMRAESLASLNEVETMVEKTAMLYNIISIQNKCGETLFHRKLQESSNVAFVNFVRNRPQDLDIASCLSIRDVENRTAIDLMIEVSMGNGCSKDVPLVSLMKSLRPEKVRGILCAQQQQESTTLHSICRDIPELMTKVLDTMPAEDVSEVMQVKDENDETPMHILAKNGLDQVLEVLPRIEPENMQEVFKCQNQKKETVFHIIALKRTTEDAVRSMLDKFPNDTLSAVLSLKDNQGATALHIASAIGNRAVLTNLVQSLGDEKALGILCETAKELNDSFLKLKNPSVKDQDVKEILKRFDAPSRLCVLDVLNGNKQPNQIHPNLKDLIRELDEEDIIATVGIETEDLKKRIGSICRKKFLNGNTIFHSLAIKGNKSTLTEILSVMEDEKKQEMLSKLNFSGKTAQQTGDTYEIRQLLSWVQTQEGFYFMPTPPEVLIFYSTHKRKRHAEEEKDSIIGAFKVIGIEPEVVMMKNKQLVIESISNATKAKPKPCGLIVIIMSHGAKAQVQTEDGKSIMIKDILTQMCTKATDDIPKALIVQACQKTVNPLIPEAQQVFNVPTSDTIIMMASVQEGVAKRNYMIPMLADELRKRKGDSSDIYDVFLRIHHLIKLEGLHQISIFHSTLTKKLDLNQIFK